MNPKDKQTLLDIVFNSAKADNTKYNKALYLESP